MCPKFRVQKFQAILQRRKAFGLRGKHLGLSAAEIQTIWHVLTSLESLAHVWNSKKKIFKVSSPEILSGSTKNA